MEMMDNKIQIMVPQRVKSAKEKKKASHRDRYMCGVKKDGRGTFEKVWRGKAH